MAGSDAVTIQVEQRSAGPTGPVSASSRMLVLTGSAVPKRTCGVLALIHGSDENNHEVYLRLERIFRLGGPADSMFPGEEEKFLSTVLRRLAAQIEPGEEQPAIELAVCMNRQVVVACLGGGGVYLCTHNTVVDTAKLPPICVERPEIVTARVDVESGDRLLLVGPQVVQHVAEREMWTSSDFPSRITQPGLLPRQRHVAMVSQAPQCCSFQIVSRPSAPSSGLETKDPLVERFHFWPAWSRLQSS